MDLQEIKDSLLMLSEVERLALQKELDLLLVSNSTMSRSQESRRSILT